jgi:hypothetical protein
MRPLLLGMARGDGKRGPQLLPSTSGDGNSAADRLLRISGMTREKYLASFERRNALPYGWSKKAAREASTEIRKRFRGRTVVVLGRETWRAIGLPRIEWLDHHEEVAGEGRRSRSKLTVWYLVPHPSGRNPWYNLAKNRAKVTMLLARLASRAGR